MRRWLAAIAWSGLALASRVALADARGTAETERAAVVKITAVFGGDSPATKHGFGFVAGERDGFLYIATANHVVRSDVDDSPATTTKVQFFFDQGVAYPATLLETHRPAPMDLAVLKIARPAATAPPTLCDDSQTIRRDTPAAYVGRDGEWYVPTSDGSVNSPTPDEGFHFEVDFARTVAVKEGTSGAPLVSERGLLGMIIQDSNSNIATVLAMEAIDRAFRGWNYPWSAPACPRPDPPVPEDGLELGLRVGYENGFGTFSGTSNTISNQIGSTIPLAIEVGYRLTSAVIVGGLFQYASVDLSASGCDYVGPGACGGTHILVGLFGRYRRSVLNGFELWGGLGAGYEWLWTHGDGANASQSGVSFDHKGFEVARLEVGGDIRIRRRVTVGPFASYSFARFESGRNTRDKPGSDWGSLDLAGGSDLRTWHNWLVLGVRMGVALGR